MNDTVLEYLSGANSMLQNAANAAAGLNIEDRRVKTALVDAQWNVLMAIGLIAGIQLKEAKGE